MEARSEGQVLGEAARVFDLFDTLAQLVAQLRALLGCLLIA